MKEKRRHQLSFGNSYFAAPPPISLQSHPRPLQNAISNPDFPLKLKNPIPIPTPLYPLQSSKPPPPSLSSTSLSSGIFELYGVGVNYSSKLGYGLPYGAGFLLTPCLILTTNRNIPTAEHAQVSLLKFLPRPGTRYRLNPNEFFYTDYSLNITITALASEPLHPVSVLSSLNKFKLYKGDTVKILCSSSAPCLVTNITSNSFSFRSAEALLPGFPILSLKSKLQGLYTSSVSSLSVKEALRIDSIMSNLISIKNTIMHPQLEEILTQYSKAFNLPVLQSGRLGDCQDLYWIESRSTNIYQYQHITRTWHSLQIVNLSSFKSGQQWSFPKNSRLVYINDGSFLVAGGVEANSGRPVREVLQVYPSSGVLMRKHSMQEARTGLCLLHRLGFVYALGGAPCMDTCERYSLQADKWEPMAGLNRGRVEATAVNYLHDAFIMIIGGDGDAGDTVERYSFQFDKWEELALVLPFKFVNPGAYLVESNKIAIFGGRCSEGVVIVEAENFVREGTAGTVEEVFRVYRIDVLPHKLVTVYPCIFMWGKNVVYFINEKDIGMPEIFEYSIKKLMRNEVIGEINQFTNISKIGIKLVDHNRLLTPPFKDVYY